jgi:DNA-binding response OmpR family regulator
MERPGVVVSADELLEKAWGFFPHTGSRDIVRTHTRNLRAKIRHTTPGREIVRRCRDEATALWCRPGRQRSLTLSWGLPIL